MMMQKNTQNVLQSGDMDALQYSRLFVAKILPNYALYKRKQYFEIKYQWNARNESLVEHHYFGVCSISCGQLFDSFSGFKDLKFLNTFGIPNAIRFTAVTNQRRLREHQTVLPKQTLPGAVCKMKSASLTHG